MSEVRPPAKNPCGSCPYRRDVPAGVWAEEEYAKLPPYDEETASQPHRLFLCHQQDGSICAGWAGCHDMDSNLAARIAAATHHIDASVHDALLDYTTEVPLFASGAEAAAHGRSGIEEPDEKARRTIDKVKRRLTHP